MIEDSLQSGRDHASQWTLDPAVTFLNHGSYGACPRPILEEQQAWRDRLEREPVLFFQRELEGEFDRVRARLGEFVGADPENLALVPNATAGVNSVLRSLSFAPGDELLTTDHEYRASRNALDFVAERSGARVVVAEIPFPLASGEQVIEAVLSRVTDRTRLLLIDHITSPTGLILPVAPIVRELDARGIDTLVDGAHGPGMVPLALEQLGAAWYTGNCHKWLCTPKGSALLYARHDRQETLRPLAISHGATLAEQRPDRSRFRVEFDWVGTLDPTAWLCIPRALDWLGSALPGGWPALRDHNRRQVLEGRRILCEALQVPAPCPEDMIGSLAAVPLPDGGDEELAAPAFADPLQVALLDRHGIEVPVTLHPAAPKRWIRISAQLYNHTEQYHRLARALREELLS